MLPDRVSNPGPLTYESDALPIALRGPACKIFLVWIMDLLVVSTRVNKTCLKKKIRTFSGTDSV